MEGSKNEATSGLDSQIPDNFINRGELVHIPSARTHSVESDRIEFQRADSYPSPLLSRT
jgi:hypothetical protein